MSPLAGFTRFRKHQIGIQAAFSSNTTATRVLPVRGPIEIDPARTEPDVDVGSLDPILAAFAGAAQYTGSWEGPVAYNDAPYYWALMLKASVITGGGTAKTHTIQAASLTADDFAYVTDQWGDDATTDWIHGGSGIIDGAEMGFGDDLGVWNVSADLVFARAQAGAGPTGGLTVDATPNWVYGADTEVFVDTAFGSIGTTKWTDAIHSATVRYTGNNDQKRFANGSNTRFQLAGFGRGPRELLVELVVAKTTETMAERQTIDDATPANRYIELRTTSPEIITGSTPFSQSVRVRGELVSATDGELSNNSTITLTYRVKYDADLGYAIRVVVVNELTAL
jgi:hypothetical protein